MEGVVSQGRMWGDQLVQGRSKMTHSPKGQERELG
jgi:hypothetical protein